MQPLRNNTATRVTVGPFLDKADGITPETSLTATNEKITFIVDDAGVPTLVIDANATSSGGSNDLVHVTGDDAGYYDLELTAAQLNYVGRAKLSINYATDHCPVFHEFTILPQPVYDALVLGSDLLDTNAAEINGSTAAAGGVEAMGADYGALSFLPAQVYGFLGTQVTETNPGDMAAAFQTMFDVDAPTFTAECVNQTGDAYAVVSDGTFGNSALKTLIDTLDDYVDTEVAAIKAKTDNLPSDPADASDIASAFGTVNSTLATIAGYIDTEVAAIKAKTDNLPSDPADASDIAAAFVTVNSKLDAIDDYVDTEVAAIKAKTDALPSDPADASDIAAAFVTVNSKLDAIDDYVDTEVAAIKAKTDNLPADPADASDIAAAFASLTTLVNDIPTNAELATALAAADDAVLAAIAALNNLSAAQVNAEVVDALATDTYAEPGQGAPPATASIAAKIGYLYKAFRNKKVQSATEFKLYGDDGATVDQKASTSDSGTELTVGEIATGP